jgi:hypothetical protein
MLADLLQPATRAETERLLEQAREYRQHLIVVFDAACGLTSTAAAVGDAAVAACGKLSDDLGADLVDQVRRMLVREYADRGLDPLGIAD